MVVMTAVVFLQVVMRYVFASSLSYSEELSRYIFLWISWVGASFAVKESAHFRVEMFVNIFKGNTRKLFELFIIFAWFLLCLFMAWYGTKLTMFLIETDQTSSAMEIHMYIPYASVPVGCAMMCVRLVIEIQKVLTGKYQPKTGAKAAVEGGEIIV